MGICSSTSSTTIKCVEEKPSLSAANIPEDVLLSNIFIRLPAKQLARMRSLSKTWNALLSHPSFIQSHLDRSINTNEDEILVVFHDKAFLIRKPFTADPSGSPCEDLTNPIKLPANTPLGYLGVIIGSVNGLICLSSTHEFDHPAFHIWNPSLSALMTLPDINYRNDIDNDYYDYCFRFGHDPKTSDYKVVKIKFTLCHLLNDMIKEFLPIEVYSMRRNSWEFITERFPSHIKYIHHLKDEVYVDGYDGHVHWLCSIDTEYMLETIMAFDLNLETFSEILLPESIQSYRRNALGVWSQKLCVISCKYHDDDCEVWVMDKYKVASSWMKLHVLSGFTGNIHPSGFTLYSKFLFEHRFRLALYEQNAAASKLFKDVKPRDLSIKVALYIDSLVWPIARNVSHQL